MTYKGFIINFWCGCYHAEKYGKRFVATREADLYEQINNYLN